MTESKNDMTKFWAILLIMLLAVAVTVTLIDLGIKASILAESNAMKLRMEDWEMMAYGEETSGRADQRSHSDGRFNAGLSGDVLGTDDAGMEAGNAANGAAPPTRNRTRNRPKPLPSDTD
jgi:hypothetical protein